MALNLRLFNTTGRLAKDRRGATAVEFGLLALPFFAIVLATVETGMVFLASETLETAVATTSRLLRTGQAQQQNMDVNAFKTQICNVAGALFDCSKIAIDVKTYSAFDTISLAAPLDGHGNLDTSTFSYSAGHGGDIVLVRAYYEWPTVTHLLGFSLANEGNGSYLMGAASAFRNEPFPW